MNNTEKYRGIVWSLICASRTHKILIDEALHALGIHGSQSRTLRIISNAPTPPSQKDIAQHMDISTASAAVTLKKLEKGGYITRTASSPDNRRNELYVTEKGKDILDATCRAMSRVDAEMFEGFTQSELEELMGYLDRINKNLRKEHTQ